jgi:SAM-dependent methyltransferase
MSEKGDAYEADVLPGLAPFAREELAATGRARPAPAGPDDARADAVPFTWRGDPRPLHRLRTVTSVQRVLGFDAPRPKALLGDAHLRRLSAEVERVVREAPAPFHGLRLEAAGKDSAVMRRLRSALAEATGLPDDPEGGDLQVRVRPGPGGAGRGGWQVLVRLTPRPLSARSWRARNLPGGLNACVAAAAWRWLGHDGGDRVLNAMCGSGTLLIERARTGPAARLVGVDLAQEALDAARANAEAAGLAVRVRDAGGADASRTATGDGGSGAADASAAGAAPPATDAGGRPPLELLRADATATPFPDGAFDVVVADPPWGDAVGKVAGLDARYAELLREAARLVPPGGRLLIVTHALAAFDAALREAGGPWRADGELRVFHGGHRPALRRFTRRAGDAERVP